MSRILRRPNFERIEDQYAREGMQYIWEFLKDQPLLRGQWEQFELSFDAAVTNEKINHNLGFVPKDIIITKEDPLGTVTFNFDDFTDQLFDITTTGAVTIRFYGGRYEPGDLF